MKESGKVDIDSTKVELTAAAAQRILTILASEPGGSIFRVGVDGGGCSGFQYGLMIEEAPGATDTVVESNGVKLYVDPISVRYLKGAQVDFVDNVAGGGFTIHNPNAVTTCGCGQSFSTGEEGGH